MYMFRLIRDARRLYSTAQGPALVRLLRLLVVPSMHVMIVHRIHHSCISLWPPFSWLLVLVCVPLHILIKILYAISIHPRADIGGGMVILHTYGIVIHPAATIGNDTTLTSGVVIGASRLGETKLPVIKDQCFLGTGAKVLGNVTVNTHTVVGANSVVLRDTQAYAIVAGNPAKTIKRIKRKDSQSSSSRKDSQSSSSKNSSSSRSSRSSRKKDTPDSSSSRNSSRGKKRNTRQSRSHVRMHKDTRGDVIHV